MRSLLVALLLVCCVAVWAEAPVVAPPPFEEHVTQGALRVKTADGGVVECPLKHTDVKAEISGFIASATVTQTFVNPYNEKIEAVYVFPLPHTAAVTDMTMVVGDRRIVGLIKRRAEARQIYQQALELGQTTSLLEQERPNIFTQSVGNIKPHSEVRIEISYFDVLKYDDGVYEFHFPMVVAPRYIPGNATSAKAPVADELKGKVGEMPTPPPGTASPSGAGWSPDTDQVPDASRITPQVLKPGYRTGHDISLALTLDAGVPIQNLRVVNHQAIAQRAGETKATVVLSPEDSIPNKDFVFRYYVKGNKPEMALLTHSKGSGEGYFMLMMQPGVEDKLNKPQPREVVFTIDVSGSMQGDPIAKVQQVMRTFLPLLGSDDTVQVVTFADNSVKLFDKPVPATPENINKAVHFMDAVHAEGGTEMLQGLKTALDAPTDPERVRMVVLCTDGDIGNETEVMHAVQAACDHLRVSVVGIGSSPNRYLLDGIAKAGQGVSGVVELNTDPTEMVTRLSNRLHRAQLAEIRLDWGGLQVSDVYPRQIPDLWAGHPVILYGRYFTGGQARITLSGKVGAEQVDYPLTIELPDMQPEHAALAPVWARQKIEDLSTQMYGGEVPEVVEAITQVALKYRLMSQYTSFVAVDEKDIDGLNDTPHPPRRVDVPLPMPDGMSFGGVFGGEVTEDATEQPALLARTDANGLRQYLPQGIQQVIGLSGLNAIMVADASATGTWAAPGVPGAAGPQGPAGAPGATGPQGSTGIVNQPAGQLNLAYDCLSIPTSSMTANVIGTFQPAPPSPTTPMTLSANATNGASVTYKFTPASNSTASYAQVVASASVSGSATLWAPTHAPTTLAAQANVRSIKLTPAASQKRPVASHMKVTAKKQKAASQPTRARNTTPTPPAPKPKMPALTPPPVAAPPPAGGTGGRGYTTPQVRLANEAVGEKVVAGKDQQAAASFADWNSTRLDEAKEALTDANDLRTAGKPQDALPRAQQAFFLDRAYVAFHGNDQGLGQNIMQRLGEMDAQLTAVRAKTAPATKLDLMVRDQSLQEALDAVSKAAGLALTIVPGSLEDAAELANQPQVRITFLDLRHATVAQALDWLLGPAHLTWRIAGGTLTVASARRLPGNTPWVYTVDGLLLPTLDELKGKDAPKTVKATMGDFLTAVRLTIGQADDRGGKAPAAVLLDDRHLLIYGDPATHAQAAALLATLKDPNAGVMRVGAYVPDLGAAAKLKALQVLTVKRWATGTAQRQQVRDAVEQQRVLHILAGSAWPLLAQAGQPASAETLATLHSAWQDPQLDAVITQQSWLAMRNAWAVTLAAREIPADKELAELATMAYVAVDKHYAEGLALLQKQPNDEAGFYNLFYATLALRNASAGQISDKLKADQATAETLLAKVEKANPLYLLHVLAASFFAPTAESDEALKGLIQAHELHGDDLVVLAQRAAQQRGGNLARLFREELPAITGGQHLNGHVVVYVNR